MHRNCSIDEPSIGKSSRDQQVITGGSRKPHCPDRGKFKKKFRGSWLSDYADSSALRPTRPFVRTWHTWADQSSRTRSSRRSLGVSSIRCISLYLRENETRKGTLKHYRNMMILYIANNVLMWKILAITLQGEAQDWFRTLPPQSIRSFDNLSVVFTEEYSSYCSIKKKSDHFFNIKKNLKESLCDYVKRFKAEKLKINAIKTWTSQLRSLGGTQTQTMSHLPRPLELTTFSPSPSTWGPQKPPRRGRSISYSSLLSLGSQRQTWAHRWVSSSRMLRELTSHTTMLW